MRPFTGRSADGVSDPEADTTSGSTSEASRSLISATVRTARTLGPTWGIRLDSHQPGPSVLSAASAACRWASVKVCSSSVLVAGLQLVGQRVEVGSDLFERGLRLQRLVPGEPDQQHDNDSGEHECSPESVR